MSGMKNHLNALAIIVLSVLFLVSCGGGGGSGGGGGNGGGTSSQAPLLDTDGDGTPDVNDTDDDNDGVLDSQDAFPLNKAESLDTDGDGIGNNVDTDDDSDGVPDTKDLFPLDKNEFADFDLDGIGDNADLDDDADGIPDDKDDSKSLVRDFKEKISGATEYIFDASREYVYISQKSAKSLSVLNVKTGALVKKLTFSRMQESLFLSDDNTKLYVALLDGEHNSYNFDQQTGAVAVIDLASLTTTNTLVLNIDPYDLVVTKKGKLIVTSGSGQWTKISAYNATTGIELGSASSIRQMSHLTLHPGQDWVFTTDTDSSPSDMNQYDISGVGITYVKDSPYHGDHRIYGEVWATPDGKYLITKGGDLFLAADMTFVKELTASGVYIKQVSFDPLGQIALISYTDEIVRSFNLSSFEEVKNNKSFGSVNFIAANNDFIYILVNSGGVDSILIQEHPCNCLNNKAPSAIFTYVPNAGDTTKTYIFDASLSTDPEGSALLYRWDLNSDGIWDTAFSSDSKYQKRFNSPGTKYVRLQVKDSVGMVATQTQSIDVIQGIDSGVAVTDSISNFLSFTVSDVVSNKTNTKIFVADKTAKRVYIVDLASGLTERYFSFEFMPEHLALSPDGSKLFVTLISREHNSYAWTEDSNGLIAVIDNASSTYTNTLAIKMDPLNIAAISNDKVIVSGNVSYNTEFKIYDIATGLSQNATDNSYFSGRVVVNSAGSFVYSLDSNYIKKYSTTSGKLSLIAQSSYSYSARLGAQGWPTPDEKYLISQGGDIFKANDLSFVASLTSPNISINNVAFDNKNQIAWLLLSDGSIDVINLISLESIKKISTLGSVSNVTVNGNNVYTISTLVGLTNIVKLDHPCPDCSSNQAPVASFTATPAAGDTTQIYTFDASASTDLESSNLSYRWDLDNDGVWDNAFTTNKKASRRFILNGTKTIRLQVKDNMGMTNIVSKVLTITQGVDQGTSVAGGSANTFGFSPADAVTDTVNSKLYLTDKLGKRLYIVDVLTGLTEKYFEFDFMPERMSISPDGTKMYVSLLTRDHNNYYSYNESASSYVAVINLANKTHVSTFAVAQDIFDVVAVSGDKVLVNGGSYDLSTILYDATNGNSLMTVSPSGYGSAIAVHPTDSWVYIMDSGLKKIDIRNSSPIILTQTSQLDGQRYGSSLWPTPDGKYLITQGGDVYSAASLAFFTSITPNGVTIDNVSFDAQAKIAFVAFSDGNLNIVNLLSFEVISKSKITGTILETTVLGGDIYITTRGASVGSLEKQAHPCPACATNVAPVANFTYTPSSGDTSSIYLFDGSLSTDPETGVLTYRWDINNDGVWDTGFSSSASLSHRFTLAGNKTIRLQVKDAFGLTNTISKSFSVTQGIDNGTAVSNSAPNILDFSATNIIADKVNSKLYVSDKTAKRLYIVDLASGLTEKYFEFDYMPERMAISLDNTYLYLALTVKAHSPYWWNEEQSGYVAVINLQNKSFVRAFGVAIDPFDLAVAANQKLLVASGSGQWTNINAYNGTTGEYLGAAGTYNAPFLSVDPTGNWLFAADTGSYPSDIHKYDVQGVGITSLGDSPYHGDHRMDGRVWVTPDGKYLITAGGDVFLSADMTYVKSMIASNLSIRSVAFNTVNQTAVVLGSDNSVVEYSLSSFTQGTTLSTIPDPREIVIVNGSVYVLKFENAKFAIQKL